MMIPRHIQAAVEASLGAFPAVAIIGARQTGKTTLARMIAAHCPRAVHLDLERPADLARLDDPELYLRRHCDNLVVIDEVQRRPELFPILRVLADEAGRAGQFLLLGSASPELLRQTSESLAGRIVFHELAPFSPDELDHEGIAAATVWLRGGFPRSVLARSDLASFQWREAFIATYLERDLPQLGVRVPSHQLRRFWQMLAHLHGQLWNASEIARSLGVSAPTANHYLSILEDTFIVRRLSPFYANAGKRLVKRPKVYFRDTGLLHALLGLVTMDQLMGHPVLGPSFEGWIVEQVIGRLPAGWEAFFYRTAAGAETDILLVRPGAPPVAVEVKASLAPRPSRGFRQVLDDVGCPHGFVVYSGEETFPIGTNITALPVTELSQIWQSPSSP